MGFKENLLNNLLMEFKQDYSSFTTRFENYREANNRDALLHHIHKLKGESGNISAENVHHLAGKIESAMRFQDKDCAEDIVDLYEALDQLLVAIGEHLVIVENNQKSKQNNDSFEFNVKNIIHLIEQLDNMLQTQQLDAIEFGEALIEQIPDGPYDAVKQSLKLSLEKLDVDEARNSVLQLKQQIGVSG